MHPKVRRCLVGLSATAALAAAPAVANADEFDSHEAFVSGTELITPSNPSFYVADPSTEVDIDHVTGKANLTEVDSVQPDVMLWAYSNAGGAVKRTAVSPAIEVDPDGTFEADDVTVTVGEAGIAHIVALPTLDNPDTAQDETDPNNLKNFKGSVVAAGLFDKLNLPDADSWSGVLNVLDSNNILGVLGLHPSQIYSHLTTSMQESGSFGFGSLGQGVMGSALLSGSNFDILAPSDLLEWSGFFNVVNFSDSSVFDGVARLGGPTSDGTPTIGIGKNVGLSVEDATQLVSAAGGPLSGYVPQVLNESPIGNASSNRSLSQVDGALSQASTGAVTLCQDDHGDVLGEHDFDHDATGLDFHPGQLVDGLPEDLCNSLKGSGVSIKRTYATQNDGRSVAVTDTLVSTDGAAHTVDLSYENTVNDDPRYGFGTGPLQPQGPGSQVIPEGDGPLSMVIDENEESADGDDDSMVGVHTFKQSPDRIYWEGEADDEGESLLDFLNGGIQMPLQQELPELFGQFAERYIAEFSLSTGQSVTQTFSQARTLQEADGLAEIVEDLPKEDTSTQQPTNSVVTIIRETVNRVSAPAVTQQAAQRARTCTVPRLRGRKRLAAERALVRAGCAVGTVKRVKSKKYKTGRIAKQSRAAGSVVAAGTRVNLSVARRVRR